MNAIGYVRISDADQSTNSIPRQIADIENYCKKNDLTLKKTFIENGQSAFNFNRKEWKELELFVKKEKDIKYLVIASMDRFSRANIADSLKKMEEIQERIGTKILTVTDPINLDTADFGVELRRIMELLFANYELKKIRKRTADGMYQSLKEGRFASMAPYGYKNSRDENNKPILVIDEEKSYFVRMAFRNYLQGYTIEETNQQLKSAGWKMKGNSALRRLLSNHVYASLIRVPARNGQSSLLTKGIHPPIISESDYWLTQERLNGKRMIIQRREDVYLRGVLRCHCGRLFTAGNSKGRNRYYWYYLCKTHKENIPAKKVHSWFGELLDNLSFPDDVTQQLESRLKTMIDESIGARAGDIMKTNLALQKLVDRITGVEEKYLNSNVSESTYKKIISELRTDESRLRRQLAGLSVNSEYYYSLLKQVLPKLSDIRTLFFTWSLIKQHSFINTVFDSSLVYENGGGRTNFLHPLFYHNYLVLKEKGLLIIKQPATVIPASAPLGTSVESFIGILALINSA